MNISQFKLNSWDDRTVKGVDASQRNERCWDGGRKIVKCPIGVLCASRDC
jgi:hypothetical protein